MEKYTGLNARHTKPAPSCRSANALSRALLGVVVSGFLLVPLSALRADDPPKVPKELGEIRGQLEFKSRKIEFQGTSVGEVGNDRKYIAGHPDSPQRGIWNFEQLPKGTMTAPGDIVPAKLTCSLFHLTKPVGLGAQVVIRVVSHTCPQAPPDLEQKGEWQWVGKKVERKEKSLKEQYLADVAAYRAKKIDPEDAKPGTDGWKAANELAEKYGYYEVRLPKVLDLVETSTDLPAGVFRNALKNKPEAGADGKAKRPLVSIYVKCETAGLLLGMEEADLYLGEKAAPKK